MSLPNRNNPYSFDQFIKIRDTYDYYCDDTFLQKAARHYCGELFKTVNKEAREASSLASTRWKILANAISQPEKRIYLNHFDAFNNRVDDIVRPTDSHQLQQEVYAQALFSKNTPLWLRFIKGISDLIKKTNRVIAS